MVGRAEQITMGNHRAHRPELQQHRIRQQRAARAIFELSAQQEIAIATHHPAGCGGAGKFQQGLAHRDARRLVVIVAHPGFEQVAQDVKPVAVAGIMLEKATELRHRIRC
jgi:hypothetical protein